MKHIGVIESNLSGSGFDGIRIAKELGCRVTFFSSGLDRYLAVPRGRQMLDEHVDAVELGQTTELAPLMERVRAVHAARPLSALMSMAEYEVVVAAEAATILGLPTPDPEAVRIARNKVHMRRRCAQHGVAMPAFRAVDSGDRAAQAAREVGLPCVVKPADETASADVRLCATVEEAVEQFEVIHAQTHNVRGQRRHHEVLVEECVRGPEVSVEILAAGDRLHVLGVTDKMVGGDGRYVELGHVFPSQLPTALRDACARVATDAVRAVGFDLGLAHVEVKIGAHGPQLIEVNPRPAGDLITELVDRSLGISCLELVVRQYLGQHLELEPTAATLRGAAIRFLTAAPGRVVAVDGAERAAAMPGVCAAAIAPNIGDLVGPLLRNEDRAGYVLAIGEDAAAAARNAERALAEMAVVTVPVDAALVAVGAGESP